MGDFTKAAVLFLAGLAVLGLAFLSIKNMFSDTGLIFMVVVAVLWAAAAAFFTRGKEKWWAR